MGLTFNSIKGANAKVDSTPAIKIKVSIGIKSDKNVPNGMKITQENIAGIAKDAVDEQAEKGRYIALLLGLKRNEKGRIDTAWGDKTLYGLVATLQRVIETPTIALPETFSPDRLNSF